MKNRGIVLVVAAGAMSAAACSASANTPTTVKAAAASSTAKTAGSKATAPKAAEAKSTGTQAAAAETEGPDVAARAAKAAADEAAVAHASNGPSLSIDSRYDRHTIPAEIYGWNFVDPKLGKELALPLDRWGGNTTTRYNYTNAGYNNAQDYYWENQIGNTAGDNADLFIGKDRGVSGMRTLLTLPTMGYVTSTSKNDACSFPKSLYAAQQDFDQYRTQCGNGIGTNGKPLNPPSPTTTSTAVDASFDKAWVQKLVQKYGTAQHGGIGFYALDNEPGLWGDTHRDVHPQPQTYDELTNKNIPVAKAVKEVDPTAKVVGPSGFGFIEMLSSEKDAQNPDATPESASHGGLAQGEWFLQEMKKASDSAGHRLLDYYDQHMYSQADGVSLSKAGNAKTQALRLRQTRVLWDPKYTDESWQNDLGAGPVRAIPRMKEQVAKRFPGTKTAITEYNFGGLESINGALAQADVLGIFGREGLDMANIWDGPTSGQPGAYAFRMYRNYDGKGGKFGTSYLRSTSSDQSKLAVYSAARSDKKTTVIVINKTGSALQSTLSVAGFSAKGTPQRFQYAGQDVRKIYNLTSSKATFSGGKLTASYPANSITLWVF